LPLLRHALPLLLAAGAAHAVELDGAARVWLGGGVDTNPHRDYVAYGDATRVAGLLQGLVQLDGALQGERGAVLANYDVGGRLFLLQPSTAPQPDEHSFVHNGQLQAEVYVLPEIGLGADLHFRDRHGAQRDYTDLGADAFARLLLQGRLDARVSIGAHRFLYWPRFQHSFWGPDFGFQARVRFNKRHSVVTSLNYQSRTFNSEPLPDPDLPPPTEPPPAGQRRVDSFFAVAVGYQYRGPWAFGFTYSFTESDSNSFAETFRRHVLSANAGVKLFWELALMGSVTLQFAQYPDGLYLSTDDGGDGSSGPIIATYDDENLNQVALKLSRPLGKWFELDFKWQLFFNSLAPANNPSPRADEYLWYLRQTFTLGLSFRIDSY
jgi:hypothetical protein